MAIKYQKILDNVLEGLPPKKQEILKRRFGLESGKIETLQSIGNDYGITRERVRQITNDIIGWVKERKAREIQTPTRYLFDYLKENGGLKKEEKLIRDLGKERFQNYVFFFLTIGEEFERFKETEEFYSLWMIEKTSFLKAKKIVDHTIKTLEKISEPAPLDKIKLKIPENLCHRVFLSYIEISKHIAQVSGGLYGLSYWPEINPRGLKDWAYLVLKQKNKPLHFTEIVNSISQISSKKVMPESVHNELIRNERFVLVGRGIYALKEWGYQPGTVKEIIIETLKRAKKPLLKEEIAKMVLAQRKVKTNTILINLQDKEVFRRDKEGRYWLRNF
jgi:DNA-directed RNA polymerase delta subunit